MSEELKPTIENPFAPANKGGVSLRQYIPPKRSVPRPVMKEEQRNDPTTILSSPSCAPGFYISQVSRRLIEKLLEENVLVPTDLPFIYQLSVHIGHLFNRPHPTLSDIEAATKFHTLERVQKIANGEETLDILRRDSSNGEMLPVKERVKLWKQVAIRLLEEMAEKDVSSEQA